MANNYTQFSAMFLGDKETIDELEKRLEHFSSTEQEEKDWDQWLYGIEYSKEDVAMWIYSEEGGNIDLLADIIADLQTDLDLEEPWAFSWANTCSKMRVDEFGGGACVIYKGEVFSVSTGLWAERKIQELKNNE